MLPRAVISNYHKLDGLKQQEFIVSLFFLSSPKFISSLLLTREEGKEGAKQGGWKGGGERETETEREISM